MLTPAVVGMIVEGNWRPAFLIFAAAGASDALDGWLARRFSLQSELGEILDPIADKALIVSIYVSLAILGVLPSWLSIMVVSRDIMIVGAVVVSWLLARPVKVRPLFISKATTAAQIVLAGVILAGEAYGVRISLVDAAMISGVAALTVASASVYLWLWVQHMRP